MRPWKIARKLVAVFLVVTLAPLALLAIAVERQVSRAVTERLTVTFEVIGDGLERELETYLRTHLDHLALIASRTQLRESLRLGLVEPNPGERARVVRILSDALASVAGVEALAVVAPDGTTFAAVARDGEAREVPDEPELAAISHARVVGPRAKTGGELVLRLAAPMQHDGRAVGVLVLDTSTEPLRAMALARCRIGASGRVSVLDPNGEPSPRTLFVAHVDEHGAATWEPWPDATVRPAASAADAIASERTIEPTGWIARVEVDRAGALAPLVRTRAIILATCLGVAALAAGTGYLVSRRFLWPIEGLVDVTESIRRGELDARADASRPDELGSLADSLNQMAAKLVERNRELEDEVAERRRIELELARLARRDDLTSLPNRSAFEELARDALARLGRHGGFVGVLFVDLDGFKAVNDAHGHSAGNEFLRAATQRMRAALRPTDRLARIGGDEFVALLEEIVAPQDAEHVAHRLHAALAQPFEIGGREIATSASIGVACCGDAERAVDALLSEADAAMYEAKRRGRACTGVFDDAMRRAALEQARVEDGLRGSIERGELDLVFQPQIDLRSGRMCAVEALLRWRHPKLGSLPAASFIAMAEATGAIVPIGEWVAREASARAAAWRTLAADDFHVSINLSAREVARPELVERIVAALAEQGCPPEALALEIQERALADDAGAACERLKRLCELGVRLCVDDFGTGSSSLARLRDLPLQGLKIDRSFVARLGAAPEDLKVVDSAIRMAHALTLRVVAAGVETPAQRRQLEQLGCDVAQGFLFSRPLRAQAIDRIVTATRTS
jgi:diguanylate cyclase (GGDEF)-like protein